ncbi:phosphoadenosine phosphosulfate reductase family protein [Paracoccus sp. PAR01]|uniref:phosphoadenosine phosphosulfate reductase domain-containing protein n=1 Tax=Paracoccus sp. PAR01 TaxID=2769282 RepID=UPI001781E7C4|nr:phosphoadenosine phosphosulfate reductase family protein [Paracoccus sp. PAR01]MBD9528994.1 phosphoadenosine phosphosulfate reductase family protein [Paracoccus sp. PAR01]
MSHYLLPEGNVQIAFSGGRTSAYLLRQIIDANGGLPDRAVVTFQNTGREMPETLDFVAEVGEQWGVRVVWMEYLPDAPGFQVVSHNSAARDGEPFEALIRKRKFLPNVMARFCTQEMKVRVAKKYLMSIGWDRWTNCVGLRADEPHRLNKPPPKDRWTVWHPLATAGVSRQDVAAFWQAQPFDLRLPNVGGNCWLGNCDGCFLKSEAHVAAFTREFPVRAAWWERMEALTAQITRPGKPTTGATFSKRYSRAEIRDFMERQGDWALNTEGALCQADDGECTA